MKFIGIDDVYQMAKPGDKLQGRLAVYPTGLPDSRKPVKELVFWDCISCLLDKPEVIDGADYYLKKLEDGSFEKYGIIREVNGVSKAPVEWIKHVVNKYCELDQQGIISNFEHWEEWELQNCYCENDVEDGTAKYTCCFNEYCDAYTEDFYTLTAVWAYIRTDMSSGHCHSLDNRVHNKDAAIAALNQIIDDYKLKLKKQKRIRRNRKMDETRVTTEEVKDATIQDFLELVLDHVANHTNNSVADKLDAGLVMLKPKGSNRYIICPLSGSPEGLGFFLELPKLAKEISEATVKEVLQHVAGKMANDLISGIQGGTK